MPKHIALLFTGVILSHVDEKSKDHVENLNQIFCPAEVVQQ